MTRLYKNGGFVDDPWTFLADETPVPETGAIALGLKRLVTESSALFARRDLVGLVVEAGEEIEDVEHHLSHFALISLRFPKYTDGRAYSTARLLRERYRYTGELRATGDVLRDQIAFMQRCGFDAFEVSHPGTINALEAGAVRGVSIHYQPASPQTDEQQRQGTRPWMRFEQI